ncbi:MAG: succinylglutamate desuccinylase/aspartoacylase family protein, partial [Gemmatimonadaceae bacterium]
MKQRVQIRDIVAERGQKVQGFVTVGETASGVLQFPLVLINGREDGPIMCFTGGVHATEYAPIDAVMRLVQELQPDNLRGAIIAVPVTNVRMFEHRTGFISPLDGLNLNKIAPGRKDGSITEILAHVMLEEIIGAAQYHIDFHAGDLGEMLLAFAGYALTGDREQDQKGEALARAFSPRLISLSTPGSVVPPFAATLNYEAVRRGVVSILAESGGNGTLEEADVQVHLDGARNVLRHLGMIDGTPVTGPRIAGVNRVVVRATRGGLVRLKVQLGEEIHAGQEVAELCNVFGEVVEHVHTPGAGIVGLIWSHKVVNTGDPIVRYWVTEP